MYQLSRRSFVRRLTLSTAVCLSFCMAATMASAQIEIPIQPGSEYPVAVLSIPLSATYTAADVAVAMDIYGVDDPQDLWEPLQAPARHNASLAQEITAVTVTIENYNPIAYAKLLDQAFPDDAPHDPTDDERGIAFDPNDDLLALSTDPLESGLSMYVESGDVLDRFNFAVGDPTSDIGMELQPPSVTGEPLVWRRVEGSYPERWQVVLHPRSQSGWNRLAQNDDGLPDVYIVVRPTIDLHQEDQFRVTIEADDIEIEHRYEIRRFVGGMFRTQLLTMPLHRYPLTFPSEEFVDIESNPYAVLPGFTDVDNNEGDTLDFDNLYTVAPIYFGDIVRIISMTNLDTRVPADSDALTAFGLDLVGSATEEYFVSQLDVHFAGIDLQAISQHLDPKFYEAFFGGGNVGFAGSGHIQHATLAPVPLGDNNPFVASPPAATASIELIDSLFQTRTARVDANGNPDFRLGSVRYGWGGTEVSRFLQSPILHRAAPPVDEMGEPFALFNPDNPRDRYTGARGAPLFRKFSFETLRSSGLLADDVGGVVIFADDIDSQDNTPATFDRGVDTLLTLDSSIYWEDVDIAALYQNLETRESIGTVLDRIIPEQIGGITDVLRTMVDVQPVLEILPSGAMRSFFPSYSSFGVFDTIQISAEIDELIDLEIDLEIENVNNNAALGVLAKQQAIDEYEEYRAQAKALLQEVKDDIIDLNLELPVYSWLYPNFHEGWEYRRNLWFTDQPVLGLAQPGGFEALMTEAELRPLYDGMIKAIRADLRNFIDGDSATTPTTSTSERFFGQQLVGGFRMSMPISTNNPEGVLQVPDSDDVDNQTEAPELYVALSTSKKVRALDSFVPFVMPGGIVVSTSRSEFNKGNREVPSFRSVASLGFGQPRQPVSKAVIVRPKPQISYEDLTLPSPNDPNRNSIINDAGRGSPPKAVIGINAQDFGANATLAPQDSFYPDPDSAGLPLSQLEATFMMHAQVFDGLAIDIIPTETEAPNDRYQGQYSGRDIVSFIPYFGSFDQILNQDFSIHQLSLYADDDTETGNFEDDDGDGLVDEELFNLRDDDGDGLIDEDLGDGDGRDPSGNGIFDPYDDWVPYRKLNHGLGAIGAAEYVNGPILVTGLGRSIGGESAEEVETPEDELGALTDEERDTLSVLLNLHPLKLVSTWQSNGTASGESIPEMANSFGGTSGDSGGEGLRWLGGFEPWTARINIWPDIFNILLNSAFEPSQIYDHLDKLYVPPAFAPDRSQSKIIRDPETNAIIGRETVITPGGYRYNPGGPLPQEISPGPSSVQVLYRMWLRNLPALSYLNILPAADKAPEKIPSDPWDMPSPGPYEAPSFYFAFNIAHAGNNRNAMHGFNFGMEEGPLAGTYIPVQFADLEDGNRMDESFVSYAGGGTINIEAYRFPRASLMFQRSGIFPSVVNSSGISRWSSNPDEEEPTNIGMRNQNGTSFSMNQFGIYSGPGDQGDVAAFITQSAAAINTGITSWLNSFLTAHDAYQTARAEAEESFEPPEPDDEGNVEPTEPPEQGTPLAVPEPVEITLADPLLTFGVDAWNKTPGMPASTNIDEIAYLLDIPDEDSGPLRGNDFFVVLRASENALVNDKFKVRIEQGTRGGLVEDPLDPEAELLTVDPTGLTYSSMVNVHDTENGRYFVGESNQSIVVGDITVMSDNVAPSLEIMSPGIGTNLTSEEFEYIVSWEAFDPDNVAIMQLYVDSDNQDFNGNLIASNLQEGEMTSFVINLPADIPNFNPELEYFVYMTINDGVNPAFYTYSQGAMRVPGGTTAEEDDDPFLADAVDYYKLERDGTIRRLGQGPPLPSVLGLSDFEDNDAVDFEITPHYDGALVVTERGLIYATGDVGEMLNGDVNANKQLILPGNPATDADADPGSPDYQAIQRIIDIEVDFITGSVYILDMDGDLIVLAEGDSDLGRRVDPASAESGQELYRDMELSPTGEGLYLLRVDGAVEIAGSSAGAGASGARFGAGNEAADMELVFSGASVSGIVIADGFGNLVGSGAPSHHAGLPLEESKIRSITAIAKRDGDFLLMTGGGQIYPATDTEVVLPYDPSVFGDEPGRDDDNVVDIETVPFNLQILPLMIEEVIAAVSSENLSAFMSFVSPDYFDRMGNDVEDVRMAMSQFFGFFEVDSLQTPQSTSDLRLQQSGERVIVEFDVAYTLFTPRVEFIRSEEAGGGGGSEGLLFEVFTLPLEGSFPFSQDVRVREIGDGLGWQIEALDLNNPGTDSLFEFDSANLVDQAQEAITAWENLKRYSGNRLVYTLWPKKVYDVEGEKLIHVDVGGFRQFNLLAFALRQRVFSLSHSAPYLQADWFDGTFVSHDLVGGGGSGTTTRNVRMEFTNREGVFELTSFVWPVALRFHSGDLYTEPGEGGGGEAGIPQDLDESIEIADAFSFSDRGPVTAVLKGDADFIFSEEDIQTITPRSGIISLGQNIDINSISTEEILAGRTRTSFINQSSPITVGTTYCVLTRDGQHFGLVTITSEVLDVGEVDVEGAPIAYEFVWNYREDEFVLPENF